MYVWAGYVLLLWVEVTLHFWEMVVQHLQPVDLQGMELFVPGLVTLMVIGFVDLGGSGYCFSLALTSALAILSVLLRLRHGLGILPFSRSVGLRILLNDLVSSLGV